MKAYEQFIEDLSCIVKEYYNKPNPEWKKKAISSVNGLASTKLRDLIGIEDRRNSGAFFTDSELSLKVLKSYKLTFGKKAFFYDPACGAGNLLISVKNYYGSLLYKKQIKLEVFGTDIHQEFIEASKLRLSICDLLNNINSEGSYTKNIIMGNGLKQNLFYQKATHIITNPPFNQIISPFDIKWASGKVSAAALFIDSIVKNVNPGTEIIAILPDVLRSGSRYEKWRAHIGSYCNIFDIKLLGQFDNHADVDVFSVLLKKKVQRSEEVNISWSEPVACASKVSDLFYVSVGSVVDNRDPHTGIKRPYLVSRGLDSWIALNKSKLSRKYQGKAIISPFLVIRRTSRRGDSNRAIGTLITIPKPVYVDNHLIILKPISGEIDDCKKLLRLLKTKTTDNWIDSQIRCRHLTVKVVSNIPL